MNRRDFLLTPAVPLLAGVVVPPVVGIAPTDDLYWDGAIAFQPVSPEAIDSIYALLDAGLQVVEEHGKASEEGWKRLAAAFDVPYPGTLG